MANPTKKTKKEEKKEEDSKDEQNPEERKTPVNQTVKETVTDLSAPKKDEEIINSQHKRKKIWKFNTRRIGRKSVRFK